MKTKVTLKNKNNVFQTKMCMHEAVPVLGRPQLMQCEHCMVRWAPPCSSVENFKSEKLQLQHKEQQLMAQLEQVRKQLALM
jgi:hypothetical protein